MGANGTAGADPEHSVFVAETCIDTFEVTVGRFRAFVESYTLPAVGAGAHPMVPSSGWKASWNTLVPGNEAQMRDNLACGGAFQTWTNAPAGGEDKPVNCVSWFEAFAFCAWDGGRLPSEAEWENASTGAEENRNYPWGGGLDDAHASYCHTMSGFTCVDGSASLKSVGSTPLGLGRWGHQDLAGNVWEWSLDWFSQVWYNNVCNNCVNADAPGLTCFFALGSPARVARGGAFSYGAEQLLSYSRGCNLPSHRGTDVGFRCIHDIP